MIRWMVGVCLILFSTNVLADDDGSYTNYDAIVNELKASISDTPAPPKLNEDFNWDDVALHADVGFTTSYVNVKSPNGTSGTGLLKGIQLGFGMNIFTKEVRAEGVFSSYAQEELDNNLKADLKEFELRAIYLPELDKQNVLRLGLGLAARYMNTDSRVNDQWTNYQASTPSSVILVGFERKVSNSVSFGPDLSYRSAITSDTFDKSAWDASFRLNATF